MAPETFLQLAIVILLFPLLSFTINIFWGKRLGRVSGVIGTTILGIDLLLSAYVFVSKVFAHIPEYKTSLWNGALQIFAGDKIIQAKYAWFSIGNLKFQLGIGIDNLTAIMLIVVTLISFLVHLFSTEYMADDKRYSRFYAYLGIFSFSMLGIVLANNFFNMYIFWELVGISSYLLIGFWYEKKSAADASKKAFIVNRVGDFGFFIGIMILYFTYGTFMFDEIFAGIHSGMIPFASGTLLTLAGIGIFCGAIGKSAQFPLHVWLPDAMEGPTPVSALIHAATMVAAGVYLTARAFPMFTADAFTFIAYIGAITAFMSATIAITQTDFKRVLAYSTVSQLGYMIMALGVGAFTNGFFHLITHAWFKAALFLGSGSVIHAMHHSMHKAHDHHTDPQDIRNMGGLRKTMPLTYLTFLFATIAISGVPLTSGFLSKDGILAGTLAFGELTGHWFIPIAGFLAAGMTAFYMFRLTIVAFHGEHKTDIAKHTHENKFVVVFPLIVLATLSLWFFYSPNPIDANSGWFAHAVKAPETVVPAQYQWSHLMPLKEAAEGGHEAGAVHEVGTLFEETMHHMHFPAMGLSLLIAGLGILLSFTIYQWKKINADALEAKLKPLHTFSYRKWYFDELYNATAVGGTMLLAKLLAIFDNRVVDGIVNLSAWVTRNASNLVGYFDNIIIDGIINLIANMTGFFGAIFRKFQTGKVQTYVAFAIVATMIIIYFIFSGSTPTPKATTHSTVQKTELRVQKSGL